MHLSPLQLERHFFSKIELRSHLDGHVGTPNIITCQIEIGRAQNDEKRFQVVLRLKLESSPDNQTTYTGEVHAVGLFRVAGGWPSEKISELVEANGSGVLFSAIRELVFNLTARGPWPPVALNTFTFIPTKQEAQPREPESAVSTSKPKAPHGVR